MPPQMGTSPLGTVPLGGAAAGSGAGQLFEETVTFSIRATMAQQARKGANVSMTLGVQAGLTNASLLDFYETVSLGVRGVIVGELPEAPHAFEETVGFSVGSAFGTRVPSRYEETVEMGVGVRTKSREIQLRLTTRAIVPGPRNMMVSVGKNMRVT